VALERRTGGQRRADYVRRTAGEEFLEEDDGNKTIMLDDTSGLSERLGRGAVKRAHQDEGLLSERDRNLSDGATVSLDVRALGLDDSEKAPPHASSRGKASSDLRGPTRSRSQTGDTAIIDVERLKRTGRLPQ
jgi:hypothetical protein